ncbi:MAG TPA: hypothetical protein ENH23_05460 [candidate division Zixibacteria bacterium]|nr:hypothetical protein [candidate division Zixibacteria bacterium]
MKDVNCHACSKVMYQIAPMGKDTWGIASKEGPIFITEKGTEYIKCPHPHCGVLHTMIESDSSAGGSVIQIMGLKK